MLFYRMAFSQAAPSGIAITVYYLPTRAASQDGTSELSCERRVSELNGDRAS
jgi:hypothetical protein